MSQPGSTMNFLIHDAHGQPQMIKVPTVNTKGSGGSARQGPTLIKTVRSAVGAAGSSTAETLGSQVLRTISLQSAKTGQRHQLFTKPVIKTISPVGTPSSSSNDLIIKQEEVEEGDDRYEYEQYEVMSPGVQNSPDLVSSSIGPTYITMTPPAPTSLSSSRQYCASPQQTPSSAATPMTASGKKRPAAADSEHGTPHYKRSRGEKASKGLRHFSMKVSEKVRRKGVTTYNEVADELVQEFSDAHNHITSEQYDQKNIRRRVYDALNVLMAMNIISKEKKEIRWLGLPTNSLQESLNLKKEKRQLVQNINEKTQILHELLLQEISIHKLNQRNKENERIHGEPAPNSTIQLPFLIVSTHKKTVIDCSLSNDKTEYLFVFNDKFEICHDSDILKQMGLTMRLDRHDWTENELREAKKMVATCMEKYVDQIAYKDGFLAVEEDDGLDEESPPSYDHSQVTVETIGPDEVSMSSEGDSDLSNDLDHV